jgi:electron transport complex protein RnfE
MERHNMGKLVKEFKKGLLIENPTFGLVLGLCPTLAVSTSVSNAIGMGAAATFVLLGSNIIISLVRRMIPAPIRIPCYIVVIATFVTINELMMKAFFPALNQSLGIFVPLIVVNCIVLGRAEAFASRNSVLPSVFDALGMGAGFTIALTMIASIRELLGTGSVGGAAFFKGDPVTVMILAPGALLTMGLLIGAVNWWHIRRKTNKEITKTGCCDGCR